MTMIPADLAFAWSAGTVALVLALSGASKVGHTDNTLAAMRGLGVPPNLARRDVARLLPVWELSLALALALGAGLLRDIAAWATVGTLVLFTILLLPTLRRGIPVECACFGTLSAGGRVTGWSITRNSALILLSAVVASLSPLEPTLPTVMSSNGTLFTLTVLLAWSITATVVLLVLLFFLQRTRAPESRRPVEPVPTAMMGDPIPTVEVVDGQGATTTLPALGRGNPVLVLFLSAECSSCAAVAARIPHWHAQLAPIRIHVLTSSRPDAVQAALPTAAQFARYGSRSAMSALGVREGPAAVMLGGHAQPVIASPVVYGESEIEALVSSAVAVRP